MNIENVSEIVGVLLAGGLSRRMGGGDKCLRPFAGRTMLDVALDRIRPQVGDVVLNANGDPARFASQGLPITTDPIEGFAGPLAGVLAGLRWAAGNRPAARHIVTVPSDAPFIPTDLVARLSAATKGDALTIVLASSAGRVHPVVGLWPVALADDLQDALENGIRKVLHWTDRHRQAVADFEVSRIGDRSIDPFFNANTPEELAEAEALYSHIEGRSI